MILIIKKENDCDQEKKNKEHNTTKYKKCTKKDKQKQKATNCEKCTKKLKTSSDEFLIFHLVQLFPTITSNFQIVTIIQVSCNWVDF